MELEDLNADERIALVGLSKALALHDGKVSPNEEEVVADMVDAFGEESYGASLDAFESRFSDEEAFRRFLETIERQDARELIYGTVLSGATADAIEGNESELLTWLAKAWNVEVTVVGEE